MTQKLEKLVNNAEAVCFETGKVGKKLFLNKDLKTSSMMIQLKEQRLKENKHKIQSLVETAKFMISQSNRQKTGSSPHVFQKGGKYKNLRQSFHNNDLRGSSLFPEIGKNQNNFDL